MSQQTADMVLTDDNYASIVSAIEQGRVIYSNIRKFVYFLISCNVAEIAILFLSTLFGWAAPLTAIQLLWLNLLSDGAPALALGMEKGDPDIMYRPPRSPDEPVINREMVVGVIVQTVAITTAVLGAYWLGLNYYAGRVQGVDPLITAETMAFVTLVMSELLQGLHHGRSGTRCSSWAFSPTSTCSTLWGSRWPCCSLSSTSRCRRCTRSSNTTPLTVEEWLAVAPLMLLPAAVAEIQKLVLFRSKRFS